MILRYDSLPSTMTEAARLAGEGEPHGTIVLAREQTAGQGRLGRSWHSAPGDGLYFTAILRYPELKPVVTMALGVAVADAVHEVTGLKPDLRWPNDVMFGPRKVAGILTQYDHGAVLAGIGLNVNYAAFPPDLEPIATSLRIETGREQDSEALLEAILRRIDRVSIHTAIYDFSTRSSYVAGRRVAVELENETVYGTTAGLNDQGFLMLMKDDGSLTTIYAGGVRPCS